MSTVIGLDARAAAEVPAGRGRYVREFLRRSRKRDDQHRYVLYTREAWKEAIFDERFSWRERELPEAVWHLDAARAANRECDVFLATNSYVTPWFLRIPTALVIHDLIPFQKGVHPNRRSALIERLTIRRALQRASLVVCDSHATRRDLLRLSPSVESKSKVVQLAVSECFSRPREPGRLEEVRRRHGLSKPFVLCAGTLEPRKNLPRLIQAFAALPHAVRRTHLLVLVGARGWEDDEIMQLAGTHAESVRVLGHVPDGDLACLYRLCTIFCYPSLYEGFGLPVLEAMSAGAAVLTSNVSSLPEVGGDAAAYVEPLSVDSIRGGLERLLGSQSERAGLRERARTRALAFSWESTAAQMLTELVALGKNHGRPGVASSIR